MDLHRRIGVIFAVFCSVALALNLLSPANPDFWTNIIELSAIMVIFSLTVIMPRWAGGFIQIAGLIVCAALAPNSPGGPFFSTFIVVFCLVLYYAYDGYKTQTGPKLTISCLIVYGVMLLALSKYDQPPYELLIRSLAWASFIYVFAYVLWVIADDIDKRFHDHRERDLLRLNSELIKLNREILDSGGCDDATGKSSRI